MTHGGDGEGEEEEVGVGGIGGEEVGLGEGLFEEGFAGVVAAWIAGDWEEDVGEGVGFGGRVDEDLEGFVHLVVVFEEGFSVVEHIVVVVGGGGGGIGRNW